MTLCDLKSLQESKKWNRFVLNCENQQSYTEFHPLHVQFTFDEMVVFPYMPVSAVHLRRTAGDTSQNADHLTMRGVESIDCKPSVLGDMLTFHCRTGRARRERYVILAQK